MKFIHTADWHLGKLLKEHSMTEDQEWLLNNRFLPLVDEEKPDVILLSGDVYDRSYPPEEAVELFDRMTEEIVGKRKIPFIIISGNHDSAERLAVASRLLKWQGLYIFGPLTRLSPVILEDADGKVAFCPLPYAEPARVRVMMNTLGLKGADQVHSYEEAETVLSRYLLSLLPAEPLRKVALAHAFAAGGTPSESERPLSIGGYDRISDAVFEEYDYTALGHLHRPQKTQKESEKIQYSGSLMRYSFDEVNQKKGVIVGELDKEGKVHTTFHELVPRYQVRCMEGAFDTLMSEETEPSDDYLQIRLNDETPVIDAMPKLRAKFPHALGVEQDMGYREDEGSRNIHLEQMSDEDILKRFVHQFRDRDLTEEEEKLALQTWDTVYRKENAQ
ncbi:exonuclease SbcCD subunit D [Dialister succinatiphilus]|uniref:exonuclease SbcCD subunit D n=1 Tax=Dialister succinatiphilus TaxID=487173 RepID=UPI003F8025D2